MFYDEHLMRVHQKELLTEREHHRLISQVQKRSTRKNHIYVLALSWLGSHLVEWGEKLQERFGDAGAFARSQIMESDIRV